MLTMTGAMIVRASGTKRFERSRTPRTVRRPKTPEAKNPRPRRTLAAVGMWRASVRVLSVMVSPARVAVWAVMIVLDMGSGFIRSTARLARAGASTDTTNEARPNRHRRRRKCAGLALGGAR